MATETWAVSILRAGDFIGDSQRWNLSRLKVSLTLCQPAHKGHFSLPRALSSGFQHTGSDQGSLELST